MGQTYRARESSCSGLISTRMSALDFAVQYVTWQRFFMPTSQAERPNGFNQPTTNTPPYCSHGNHVVLQRLPLAPSTNSGCSGIVTVGVFTAPSPDCGRHTQGLQNNSNMMIKIQSLGRTVTTISANQLPRTPEQPIFDATRLGCLHVSPLGQQTCIHLHPTTQQHLKQFGPC